MTNIASDKGHTVMRRIAILMFCWASAAACASYDLPAEQLDSVRGGSNALLITSYEGDLGCSSVELNLRDVNSGRRYLAINGRPLEMTSTHTAVLVLLPGEYHIDSGQVHRSGFLRRASPADILVSQFRCSGGRGAQSRSAHLGATQLQRTAP